MAKNQNNLSNSDFTDPDESLDFSVVVDLSIAADVDKIQFKYDQDVRFELLAENEDHDHKTTELILQSWDVNSQQRGGHN